MSELNGRNRFERNDFSAANLAWVSFRDGIDLRLGRAWTATDNCAGQPSTTPGSTTVGGASPYWTSWTFNDIGLRTGQVQHGIGQADTTTGYTYPTSGAGAVRPHALTSTTVSGPACTTSSTFGYDNAGNSSTRTVNGDANAPTGYSSPAKVNFSTYWAPTSSTTTPTAATKATA
ncbi:hypothetical protein [Actinokineospora inagensis]|uniref:hypothetical protein n=1 Tax=Actinokineospora inagensis TaxID=103730 RepID=UPI00040DCB19|nr:hypothetical protein [Actinokineospora inagensis]